MAHQALVLSLLVASLAGCAAVQAPPTAQAEQPTASASGPSDPSDGTQAQSSDAGASPEPAASPSAAPGRRLPVAFEGAVVVPDPQWAATGLCPEYNGWYGDLTQHVTWEQYSFAPGSFDGWTFAFDVDGMVAEFRGTFARLPAQAEGQVPVGAGSVAVCSAAAVRTAFTLTLTPPTSRILSGRILAPHVEWYEHGSCGSITPYPHEQTLARLDNVVFSLGGDHGGWAFAFDAYGFVLDGGTPRRSGVLPPGTDEVTVCNPSDVGDFILTLSPPA